MQGLRVFSIYKTSAALPVALAVALPYVLVHDVDLFLQLVLACLLILPLVRSIVARCDFFAPINIFCVLYGIGFVLAPLLQRVGWVMSDPAYAHYDASFATRTSLLSIVAILLVYLAYYEGGDNIEFMLPVFVFEGEGGFQAFVEAITDQWLL